MSVDTLSKLFDVGFELLEKCSEQDQAVIRLRLLDRCIRARIITNFKLLYIFQLILPEGMWLKARFYCGDGTSFSVYPQPSMFKVGFTANEDYLQLCKLLQQADVSGVMAQAYLESVLPARRKGSRVYKVNDAMKTLVRPPNATPATIAIVGALPAVQDVDEKTLRSQIGIAVHKDWYKKCGGKQSNAAGSGEWVLSFGLEGLHPLYSVEHTTKLLPPAKNQFRQWMKDQKVKEIRFEMHSHENGEDTLLVGRTLHAS